MLTKRIDDDSRTSQRTAEAANALDTYRPVEQGHGSEDRITLFWRIFGGTLLSIAALVTVTVFNSINGSIAELRSEVARLNEAKGVMVSQRGEIDNLKERASKYRMELEDAKKDSQAKLDALRREQDTAVDALRKDLAAQEVLKERIAMNTTDLKAAKDELQKVRQDVDKNQAGDNERRDQRTAQMKVLDETIKELQKAMQEAREKLARLEGRQTPMTSENLG